MERLGGQGGRLRSATTAFDIALPFFMEVHPEVIKDNDSFKVVLQLSHACPSLLDLFRDVVQACPDVANMLTNAKQLSFVLRN